MPGEYTSFHMLDVGQGACCLWQTEDVDIVIDVNLPPTGTGGTHVKSYLLQQGVRGTVDLLLLTGWDADHADPAGVGMILRNFTVDDVWIPDFEKNTDAAEEVWAQLERSSARRGTDVSHPCTSSGRVYHFGDTKVTLFNPDGYGSAHSNNNSIVAKLEDDDFSVLVTGDCQDEQWDRIVARYGGELSADVLVAPHHGADNGMTPAAFEAIDPKFTLISVGADNPFGHPGAAALRIYNDGAGCDWCSGSYVYSTAEHGALTVSRGWLLLGVQTRG